MNFHGTTPLIERRRKIQTSNGTKQMEMDNLNCRVLEFSKFLLISLILKWIFKILRFLI